MKRKTIVILSISFIIVLSLIFVFFIYIPDNHIFLNQNNSDDGDDESENPNSDDPIVESITPVITVEIDKYNKTITIRNIGEGVDLFWYNVDLVNGSATLPEGAIDEGDTITDCIGKLDFMWIPTNEIFLHSEFLREEE